MSVLGVGDYNGKSISLIISDMSEYWKEELYEPAAHPPKGPAGAAFLQRTMQAFPLGPPLQVTPAGISEISRQFTSNDSKAKETYGQREGSQSPLPCLGSLFPGRSS